MEIYKEYSEDEIDAVREFIVTSLIQFGIERTMQILNDAKNDKKFWEIYDEDRKKEQNTFAEIVYSDDPVENALIKAINNVFSRKKTEKMDEEQEEVLRMNSSNLQKIWNIVLNDVEIKEEIVDAINNLDYDIDDIASRMETVKSIISILRILPYKNFNQVYDAIGNIIKNMNYNDLTLIYVSSDTINFFSVDNFKKIIIDKIYKMSNEEFMYYLHTTCDGLDGNDLEIRKAKQEKTKICNSLAVSDYYMAYNGEYISPDNKQEYVDRVLALNRGLGNDDKNLDLYSKLTNTEFVRFLLMYHNTYDFIDKKLMESSITLQKLKKLSNSDMIALAETYGSDYLNYLKYKDDEEDRDIYEKYSSCDRIFDELKNRSLISDEYKKLYTKDEFDEANKKIEFYKNLNSTNYIPCDFINFNYSLNENDEDIDERSVDEILLQRFKDANIKIENQLKTFKLLDELFSMSDLKILQECNKYNVKLRKDQITKSSSRTQSYILNYLKKRIISMPSVYGGFFQIIDGGCLNDAMELKAEELQNSIIKKENDFEKGEEG